MSKYQGITRHSANPIISPKDVPFECAAVFNSGATMFNGKYLLLLRIEDYKRHMFFHVATSDDGVKFDINPEPINYPLHPVEAKHGGALAGKMRFDPRITKLEDVYYISSERARRARELGVTSKDSRFCVRGIRWLQRICGSCGGQTIADRR